ncbi:penicillin-binding protein, partial [Butyricicoccus sp. 1XD8-22]
MKRRSYFRKKRRHKWLKITVLTLVGFICAIAFGLLSLRIYAQIAGAPPLTIPKASVFLDSNGNKIGDYYTEERRYWVELEDISPYLVDATIAVEDKEFYSHNG